MNFPPFNSPNSNGKLPRDWSKEESELYFSWLTSNMISRTNELLHFLGLTYITSHELLLVNVQEKVEHHITSDEFTYEIDGKKKLTDSGYALAADLGLLVARILIERGEGHIKWEILKKSRLARSNNLPVFIGVDGEYLDPIDVSISECVWIANGNKSPNGWLNIYTYWSSRMSKNGPTKCN